MTLTLPKRILRRGSVYAVRFTVPNELRSLVGRKEIVRSLGTSDLAEAVAKRDSVLRDIRKELLSDAEPKPKVIPKSDPVTPKDSPRAGGTDRHHKVRETATRWLAEADGISGSTRVRYRQHLDAFAKFTADMEVRRINRQIALDFMAYLKSHPSERTGQSLSHRSLGSYQTCLASYWSVLDHWGLVDGNMRNPFSSLQRRVAGQRKKSDPRKKLLRPVTREEAKALIDLITDSPSLKYRREMIVVLRLLWVTACRLNEIAALRVEQITDHGDHIALRITKAKTEAGNRTVMIVGDDDCRLLREAIRQSKITPPAHPENDGMLFPRLLRGGYDRKPGHYLGKALEKARKSLPGHDGTWDMHSFRRTGVAALVNAGVAREARNLAVGHANNDDIGLSVYAKRADLSEIIKATFEALHRELGGGL